MTNVTIGLDEKIYRRLRRAQARRIMKTKQNCSFSKIIDLVLKNGLKKYV